MSLPLNNPSLFNAAFAGCLAGQVAGSALTGIASIDQTAATYNAQSQVAYAFAEELDGKVSAVSNLSSSNATVPQASSATVAGTQLALVSVMFGLCFSYWSQRKSANLTASGDAGATPSDYSYVATSIAAQFSEAQAAFTTAGSLT